jgi:hypothetical protein
MSELMGAVLPEELRADYEAAMPELLGMTSR